METAYWKKCSTCKKEIGFSEAFYLCSVSTCKHPRKGFRFCSVDCWDAHLGFANHRESWAEDAVAPSREEFLASEEGTSHDSRAPKRTVLSNTPQPHTISATSVSERARAVKTDTLVVVSKVKTLIKDESGMSTSQCCIDALTEKVVDQCLKAIERAKAAGRKTVMGRDVVK